MLTRTGNERSAEESAGANSSKRIASLLFLVLAGGRRGRGEVVDTPEVVRVELLVGFLRYPEAV